MPCCGGGDYLTSYLDYTDSENGNCLIVMEKLSIFWDSLKVGVLVRNKGYSKEATQMVANINMVQKL